MKGLAFVVQLKGTDHPNFVDSDNHISFQIEVSTINFLLSKLDPPMIAVCHTSDPEQPVFWVWLKEAIEIVKSSNGLLLVWLTPTYANPACISNSIGLR
jgi:hypothetical protein